MRVRAARRGAKVVQNHANLNALRRGLEGAYCEFFQSMKINRKTGLLKHPSDKKCATYPYIGSQYGSSRKVLFVGIDIGDDRKCGGIQSFESRRKSIEEKLLFTHNKHIAGTYIEALYFLRDRLGWSDCWNSIAQLQTYKDVLDVSSDLLAENPLSYIALTNYYKFVTKGSPKKSDAQNRRYICAQAEKDLFKEEVRILDPEIIMFQGTSYGFPGKACDLEQLEPSRKVYYGRHPSRRKQKPQDWVNTLILA